MKLKQLITESRSVEALEVKVGNAIPALRI
jgi:hypothetical protein